MAKQTVETLIEGGKATAAPPLGPALVRKEAGIQKGASNPLTEKVADLLIEQIIKIAKTKADALLGKDTKMKVKEIVGTCQSMGILVEGMPAQDALKAIDEGKFDEEITSGKTEISEEEKQRLAEEFLKKSLKLDELSSK